MLFYYVCFFKKSGKRSLIIKPILLTPNCISIGSDVSIRNNARIEGVFKHYEQVFTPNINIQNNVNIEQNVHITCSDLIEIGANTAIAANVTITDTIHEYENVSILPKKQPLRSNKVIIESDCTIYNNAVILPGTVLGKNVVVAANSVVCGVFPSFSVVGGIPAKIIKRYCFEKNKWLKTDKEGNFI
jgi:acetyltransferase-like isoleucine patch superfamily enzyme